MAALQLGGSTLGALLNVLFDKFSSEIMQRVGSMWEIEDDIFELHSTLRKVKTLIANAEERSENNKEDDLKVWIDKVRNVAYEVVDLLDDLELTHMNREKQKCILNSFMPEFVFDLVDSSTIQNIQKKLDRIVRLADNYELKKSEINVKQLQWRETSSILNDETVIGRDEVKSRVIRMLLSQSIEKESYDVIPIIGIGGVGKTTLAQLIYNNDDIKKHFQLKIWVCVSDDFDEKRLTKEIIKSISSQSKMGVDKICDHFYDDNWDVLQSKLKDLITDERFLLVLDDVWNEKDEKWLNFKKPFRFGQKGSKVIVTTRKETVAKMVTDNMKPIELEGLPNDDFWILFRMVAFSNSKSREYPPSLESIGRDICKKLQGSPLAAKTVGRLLNCNLNVTHWKEILESELWKLPQNKYDIIPALLLSYRHLPECLKPCFAFFSLFPKAHIFDMKEVVRMWSAHNWIKDEENKLMEDVGKGYINALFSRSMIQSYQAEELVGIKYKRDSFVMHDLIHDLALMVSKDEYFYVKNESDLRKIPKTVRHLSVYCSDSTKFEMLYRCLKNLRTLIVRSTGCKVDLDVIFVKATKLRLLKVSDTLNSDVPESIQNLSHLRYLDLDSNQFRSLPDSFSTLHFLQVLVLKYCPLHKLPNRLNTLASLRYLKLPQNHFTDSDITSVGNLHMLQKLHFEVSNEMGHRIMELRNMNMLRKLYISNLERVSSMEKAMEGNLKGKDKLDFLELCWNNDGSSNSNNTAEGVIEGLQPPENIKDLKIVFYGGKKSPSWMKNHYLSNMQHLEIIDCNYWNIDVSFGHLPHLVSLSIGGMKAVQKIGPKFFGEGVVTGFPSLELLRFKSLENWEEWIISSTANHNTQIFPRLKQLIVLFCSKLNGIPFQIPPSLSTLHLVDCPNLAQISTFPPSIACLRIYNCGEVCNSFNTTHLEGLASLKEIYLRNCPNLTLLSPSLTAVEELMFYDCPELKLESWLEHLTCLRFLFIRGCPRAVESLLKERIVLPSSIKKFAIKGVTSTDISSNFDIEAALKICMKNLSSLETFFIENSPDASLTKWIQNIPFISQMIIVNCQELDHANFKSLINLKHLQICRCPKLLAAGLVLPSQLEFFWIDEASKVQLKELLFLLSNTSLELKVLVILRCSELTYFDADMEDALIKLTKLHFLYIHECCSCQSLPTRLNDFLSLSTLTLSSCDNIQSLPENGLPSSLKTLSITDCLKLREQCKMGGGDWHKISHIQDIYIDMERIRQNSKMPQQRSGRKSFLRTRGSLILTTQDLMIKKIG